MGSVSLESPQTLNLYAYCVNDPTNQIDPSGLGFFSFFGKLFKAIGKAIKIIAVVLVVVVVVALVIAYAAPMGSAALSFAKFLLFKLAPVLAKILAGATGFQMGGITLGPGGTPPWNPEAGGGTGSVSTFMAVGQQRKRKMTGLQILLENIAIAKRNLGARWNDFLATINDNKNPMVSTALVLCHASQESSFFRLTDTGSGFMETTPGQDGEIGLMQLKPDTARSLGVDPAQLTDVATNVTTGTGYLTGLINQHGSLRTALGRYKQGGGPLSAKSRRYADEIIQCSKQVKY